MVKYLDWIEWGKLYLSRQNTEEDKNKHPLEGISKSEEIGCESGLIEDVHHAKCPCSSKYK